MKLLSWIRLAKTFDENLEKYDHKQRLFLKSDDSNPLTTADSSTFSRHYILYSRGEMDSYAFSAKRTRARVGNYPEIEKQLLTYIEAHRDKNEKGLINLTRDEVKQRAMRICQSIAANDVSNCVDFKATDGWLSRLQKRRGIHFQRKPRKTRR